MPIDGFYRLSDADRIALATIAIEEQRTLIERWSVLQNDESQCWSERAAQAAALLTDCNAVADVGCGLMSLRSYLRPGTRYIPVDVVARDTETVIVDLNSQSLPDLDVDAYAALGLLEYLFDIPRFLKQISKKLVTSYNSVELSTENRRAHAWVNDYSTAQLESLFKQLDFRITNKITLSTQQIWSLEPPM